MQLMDVMVFNIKTALRMTAVRACISELINLLYLERIFLVSLIDAYD